MPKVVKEDLQKNSNADDNAGPDTTAEETNTDNLAVKADERDITVVPERNTTEPAPVKDYTDARSAKTDKNGRGGQNERQNQNERMDRNVSKDQNQENRNRDNVRSFDGRNQDGRGGRSFDGRNQDGRDGRSFDGRNQDGRGGRSFEGRNQDGRDGRSFDGRNQDRRDSQNQGRGQKPFGDRNQGLSTGPRDGGRSFDGRNQGVPDKDSDQRRGFNRKGDNRSSGGSLKSELANELGKDKRAENIKNQNRDKNRKDRNRDYDEDGLKNAKKKDPNRKGAFQKPVAKPQVVEEDIKTITVPEVISIKDLADKMKQNASAIVKKLFMGGKIVNVNSEITFEEAENIALDYDIICEKEVKVNMVEELLKETEEDPDTLVTRPPVVCVMGHVDHGKTSLLDAIRKTNVTAREAGGITQHIGAYMVEISGRKITFLDTPGHEAFTSMRMRGAKSTDIAILVVAADDGVMPQTVEAINHAKAANVSIIVAVNKIDKPGANIERVKQELTEHGLVAEDWGGDTVFVPVSAKTGEGIENLLEMVLLTADVLELKANPDRRARGIVIEAQLDKGRGPVATVLIQKGTLNVGDNVAIGAAHGKVRAMIDDNGRKVKTATPSTPVEILGLNAVPQAGEVILAVADEKEARTIAEAFIAQSKEELIAETKARLSLDGLFSQIQAGEVKELNIIIKADVMGSVEAVKQSLLKLSNEEVVVRVIHGGVGNINESDVTLASASNAIIIGFNVKPDNTAKDIAEHEKIDIKLYKVIYDAINDVEAAMKGMLKPIYEEKVIGHAEIRQLFKASVVGVIAGSYVLDGKIVRGCKARIRRNDELIFEGNLASLKRFKDDVKEVAAGYECGLVFEKFSDLAELDQAEFYVMEEVPRK
ncbi:MAG: translation initiation factor IF-2 [Lachnospiraceae bacterium]|nr:translation initiation factor IF-2 [Lachnospiraceae bacterium]